MSKPDVVAILDFQSWFNVLPGKTQTFDCGEDTSTCDGALAMLCGRNITGNANYAAWWGFEDCMMKNQSLIPGNMGVCAKANGISEDKLTTCTSGPLGQQLLKLSEEKAKQEAVQWTPWFILQDVPPKLEEIHYLQVVCDAYTKAGGSPLPASCTGADSSLLLEAMV